jgi:hypothetical protein
MCRSDLRGVELKQADTRKIGVRVEQRLGVDIMPTEEPLWCGGK